ncbi:hypothetical protein [Dyella japonica]|uniref:hypothetical protein n=1 Tax=Dyella japonica TaxID=231455 RepID=UPI0012E01A90|nr:hypothetical protein [Dyella japonica]
MLDGLISGIIGGLFAQPIARFLRRFKLSAIFFVTCLATFGLLFLAGVPLQGWKGAAFSLFTKDLYLSLFISAGFGFGLAIVIWIISPNRPKDKK